MYWILYTHKMIVMTMNQLLFRYWEVPAGLGSSVVFLRQSCHGHILLLM
jgi:hypothetical protein